jgi:hypothetical protein
MEVFQRPSLAPPRASAQPHASARIWLLSVAPGFGCQCISLRRGKREGEAEAEREWRGERLEERVEYHLTGGMAAARWGQRRRRRRQARAGSASPGARVDVGRRAVIAIKRRFLLDSLCIGPEVQNEASRLWSK